MVAKKELEVNIELILKLKYYMMEKLIEQDLCLKNITSLLQKLQQEKFMCSIILNIQQLQQVWIMLDLKLDLLDTHVKGSYLDSKEMNICSYGLNWSKHKLGHIVSGSNDEKVIILNFINE